MCRDWKENIQNIDEEKKRWNTVAKQFDTNTSKNRDHEYTPFDFFRENNVLSKDMRVLDIGCGSGRWLRRLSPLVKEVVGIDLSEEMIKISMDHIKKDGLKNVEVFVSPWQLNKNIKRKNFDLVFASMTPAIHNEKTLLKMCEVSRKYCFLSGFLYRENKISNLINKSLGKKVQSDRRDRIYSIMNTLWKEEYYPTIKYLDTYWLNEFTFDQAKEYFSGMENRIDIDYILKDLMDEKWDDKR